MTEKATMTDRVKEAVSSPMGKRIADDVMQVTGGRSMNELVQKASKRPQKARNPKARDRGRQ